MKYINRKYEANFKYVYPFQSEFCDVTNKFFQTKFIQQREFFKPRTRGEQLPFIISTLGFNIFQNEILKTDLSKYIFLKNDIKELDADLLEVTELWGYVPSDIFTTQETQLVSFYGTQEYYSNEIESTIGTTITYNASYFAFPKQENFYAGDTISFHRPAVGGNYGELNSGPYKLVEESGEFRIYTGDITLYQNDGDSYDLMSDNIMRYLISIRLKIRTYKATTRTTNIDKKVEYFYDRPEILEKTVVKNELGGLVEWSNEGVVCNLVDGKYLIEDSYIHYEKELGLWRRELKLTDWKIESGT